MSNKPVMLIFVGMMTLVLIAGLLWTGHKRVPAGKTHSGAHPIFDVASGDTNNEVLREVAAGQRRLAAENKRLRQRNSALVAQGNADINQRLQAMQQRFDAALKAQAAQLKADFAAKPAAVRRRGSSAGDAYPLAGHSLPTAAAVTVIHSVPDLSKVPVAGSPSLPVTVSANHNGPPLLSDDTPQNTAHTTPVYTIPDGATLANIALLSPLIGEVPVSGALQAPAFPFKAMVSRREMFHMFSANGIPLPSGISGMVLQGYAVGSMSLGCTRAYVTKILFVFHDGHFTVYPKKGGHSDATAIYPKHSLGYLSDAWNNPCIRGHYITDAPKVIAGLAGFGGFAGMGQGIADAQTQTFTSALSGTANHVVSGNTLKYGAGIAVGEGAREALAWYRARVHDIFDAIFVSSTEHGHARHLILNVTRTIPIDIHHKGRKLRYANQSNSFDHNFE